jgi:hypothetical protein
MSLESEVAPEIVTFPSEPSPKIANGMVVPPPPEGFFGAGEIGDPGITIRELLREK